MVSPKMKIIVPQRIPSDQASSKSSLKCDASQDQMRHSPAGIPPLNHFSGVAAFDPMALDIQ
jgi:hypothetical protein